MQITRGKRARAQKVVIYGPEGLVSPRLLLNFQMRSSSTRKVRQITWMWHDSTSQPAGHANQ